MMTGHNNGRYPRTSLCSDCIIQEKTVVLQKRDNEGFGFVLRGAKADTPIEEFTPTPAFPALQYLESVDEGGVAWQAGLRTGDFLIEVGMQVIVSFCWGRAPTLLRLGSMSWQRGRGARTRVLVEAAWTRACLRLRTVVPLPVDVCVWVVFEALAVSLWRVGMSVEFGRWS